MELLNKNFNQDKNKKFLAVIQARGGSKGIPKKISIALEVILLLHIQFTPHKNQI